MLQQHNEMTGSPIATLLDAALALAADGLLVFPCNAEKRPVCAGGFKAATRDPQRIKSLFAISTAALIGVPTGAVSGIFVVDIDRKSGGHDWLNSRQADLPFTRTHRTMNDGLHLIFQMPDIDLRNTASRIAPGVDTRGNGGYIIVPPSQGYTVANPCDIVPMPAWLIELCLAPPPIVQAAPAARKTPPQIGGTVYGLAALDDECNTVRNAPGGTQEHTLNAAALKIGQLVAGGEVEIAVARSALIDAGVAMHPTGRPWLPNEIERKVRRGLDDGARKPRNPPPIVAEAQLGQAIIDKAMKRSARHKIVPLAVAPDLLDVPGALRMFIDWAEATAPSPQPFLALAAGLTLIGLLAGRKYRTDTNLRTNIYAISVADSGAGKDHARKCIKGALLAAGLTDYIGGDDIASGSGMMTALARHPAILFQIDEFGDWLRQILGDRAPAHKAQIAQKLKTLYSSAGEWVAGTEYADQKKDGKPRVDIFEPHACLYATTTPGQLWHALSGSGAAEDGLMARLMLFVSPVSYPDARPPMPSEPPEALVSALQAIAAGIPSDNNLAGIMAAGVRPSPATVPMTLDASDSLAELRLDQLAQLRAAEGTPATGGIARWAENAVKLALIRAISRAPGTPVIERSDMIWARNLAAHCIHTALRDIEANSAETPFEKLQKRIIKTIQRHGSATPRDFSRAGIRVPPRDMQAALQGLIEGGEIEARNVEHMGAGRPTLEYLYIGHSDVQFCNSDG